MVCANYGNAGNIESVLSDWFTFLGGKPAEVIIADAGSDATTRSVYNKLLEDGKIDTLIINKEGHPESGKECAFIREYHVANFARKKYILFFKFDTLPFRKNNDDWLEKATQVLDEGEIFAFGGSFNYVAKHHDSPVDGYYMGNRLSENFALIRRDIHQKAMREFAPTFIDSNFTKDSPFDSTRRQRFFVEIAWEEYMRKHNIFTLVKKETDSWTVFHTNATDGDLQKIRGKYKERKSDVTQKMNAGLYASQDDKWYYGKKKELRKMFKNVFSFLKRNK